MVILLQVLKPSELSIKKLPHGILSAVILLVSLLDYVSAYLLNISQVKVVLLPEMLVNLPPKDSQLT